MNADMESFQLPFLAAVPRGHEVLVATVSQSSDAQIRASLVFDRTAGCLYCAERLWAPLCTTPGALADPLATLRHASWVVESTTVGRSLGAIVQGESSARRTRLFIEPSAAAPYR